MFLILNVNNFLKEFENVTVTIGREINQEAELATVDGFMNHVIGVLFGFVDVPNKFHIITSLSFFHRGGLGELTATSHNVSLC